MRRREYEGKKGISALATWCLPHTLTVVPTYLIAEKLGWVKARNVQVLEKINQISQRRAFSIAAVGLIAEKVHLVTGQNRELMLGAIAVLALDAAITSAYTIHEKQVHYSADAITDEMVDEFRNNVFGESKED